MSENEIETGKGSANASKKTAPTLEQPGVERWWSTTDPNHMIVISVNGVAETVTFSEYGYDCDLATERGRLVSAQLQACGREGKDIFVIGKAYPDNENGSQTELMRTLRAMANEYDGVNKIKGLFTHKELVKAGIPPASDDADALILLALRTKSIKGRIEKESAE